MPVFCRLELQPIVEHRQNQLQDWESLGPQIWSPYQRPYFFSAEAELNNNFHQSYNKINCNAERFQLSTSCHSTEPR